MALGPTHDLEQPFTGLESQDLLQLLGGDGVDHHEDAAEGHPRFFLGVERALQLVFVDVVEVDQVLAEVLAGIRRRRLHAHAFAQREMRFDAATAHRQGAGQLTARRPHRGVRDGHQFDISTNRCHRRSRH